MRSAVLISFVTVISLAATLYLAKHSFDKRLPSPAEWVELAQNQELEGQTHKSRLKQHCMFVEWAFGHHENGQAFVQASGMLQNKEEKFALRWLIIPGFDWATPSKGLLLDEAIIGDKKIKPASDYIQHLKPPEPAENNAKPSSGG